MYSDQHVTKWLPGFVWATQLYKNSEDKIDRSIARATLRKMVAKYTDRSPTMGSKKALELANRYNRNLFEMRWSHRNKCGKVNSKPALMWEHTTPNSKLCDKLIACKLESEIFQALKNYSGVCWITREEDNALNAAGYLNKRPGGWKRCYKYVGIDVIIKSEV